MFWYAVLAFSVAFAGSCPTAALLYVCTCKRPPCLKQLNDKKGSAGRSWTPLDETDYADANESDDSSHILSQRRQQDEDDDDEEEDVDVVAPSASPRTKWQLSEPMSKWTGLVWLLEQLVEGPPPPPTVAERRAHRQALEAADAAVEVKYLKWRAEVDAAEAAEAAERERREAEAEADALEAARKAALAAMPPLATPNPAPLSARPAPLSAPDDTHAACRPAAQSGSVSARARLEEGFGFGKESMESDTDDSYVSYDDAPRSCTSSDYEYHYLTQQGYHADEQQRYYQLQRRQRRNGRAASQEGSSTQISAAYVEPPPHAYGEAHLAQFYAGLAQFESEEEQAAYASAYYAAYEEGRTARNAAVIEAVLPSSDAKLRSSHSDRRRASTHDRHTTVPPVRGLAQYADSVAHEDAQGSPPTSHGATCIVPPLCCRSLTPFDVHGVAEPADCLGGADACSSRGSRIVSISVTQWEDTEVATADWQQLHRLLSPTSHASPADVSEEPEGVGSSYGMQRAKGVSAGAARSFFQSSRRPRNAKERPTPAELHRQQFEKQERAKRPPPPKKDVPPPPAPRMCRPHVCTDRYKLTRPPPPKPLPRKPPPPPPPLPPYAGAVPRQHPGPRPKPEREFGLLPSETESARRGNKLAPIVCFTNTKLASQAPRPAQLEPHMQLPQRIQFFLRTRITNRVTYPFDPQYPDSKYLLTAAVQRGYERAGPTFILDDEIVRKHVIGCESWPSAEPYLTGELHLEIVVPTTERINPSLFSAKMMINAGNQSHRGDGSVEKPAPLQHTMGSSVLSGNELPRINVPVTPKPIRPSVKVRKVFDELAFERPDQVRVMRLSALPLALEALGGDLNSWEGRSALDLARGWAELGGDATIDFFEFAQAARELETVRPPPRSAKPSERATVQGSRSWRYGSPHNGGLVERKQMMKDIESELKHGSSAEGKEAKLQLGNGGDTSVSSRSNNDDDGNNDVLLTARLAPTKSLSPPRSPTELVSASAQSSSAIVKSLHTKRSDKTGMGKASARGSAAVARGAKGAVNMVNPVEQARREEAARLAREAVEKEQKHALMHDTKAQAAVHSPLYGATPNALPPDCGLSCGLQTSSMSSNRWASQQSAPLKSAASPTAQSSADAIGRSTSEHVPTRATSVSLPGTLPGSVYVDAPRVTSDSSHMAAGDQFRSSA